MVLGMTAKSSRSFRSVKWVSFGRTLLTTMSPFYSRLRWPDKRTK
jgi:hypothetical protein